MLLGMTDRHLRKVENGKGMDDFRATRLVLSPGRPLFASLDEFEFRPYKSSTAKSSASASSKPACVENLVCHIDRSYTNIGKWQHYVQLAFPCWSLFQRFPDAKHYLDIHPKYAPPKGMDKGAGKHWQSWIKQLNKQFQQANIQFLATKIWAPADSRCNWIANTTVTQDDFGWADPSGDGPLHNFRYFMQQRDISALQRVVLGSEFAAVPATSDQNIQLMILDRQDDAARRWLHANATLASIQKTWGQIVNARLIPSFQGYSLKEQAVAMHTADVIISPHGAQLTNTVFIRPCTVVLELFPRHYYYPKKGPLVMEAGGIAYDGYHFDGSPRSETPSFKSGGVTARTLLREVPITASPQSILFALPDLLHEVLTCRKRWKLRPRI